MVDSYCIPHFSCPCSIAPCTLTYKHKFKDKIIKNFKMVMAEHWIKRGPLLNQGPLGQYRSCAHQAIKWSLKISCEMLISEIRQLISDLLRTSALPIAFRTSKNAEDLAPASLSSEKMGRTSGNGASDLFLCWICWLSNKDLGMSTDCFILTVSNL